MGQALWWRGTNSLETKPDYYVQMNEEAGLLILVGVSVGEWSQTAVILEEKIWSSYFLHTVNIHTQTRRPYYPLSLRWRKPASSHESETLGSLLVYAHVKNMYSLMTSSAPHEIHLKAEAGSFKSFKTSPLCYRIPMF